MAGWCGSDGKMDWEYVVEFDGQGCNLSVGDADLLSYAHDEGPSGGRGACAPPDAARIAKIALSPLIAAKATWALNAAPWDFRFRVMVPPFFGQPTVAYSTVQFLGSTSVLDASDVIQETHIEIARRIEEYLTRAPMPFHLWLRKTAYENLLRQRRRHVSAQQRSVERERPIPERSSMMLAEKLLTLDAPSKVMAREEAIARVRQALAELEPIDEEVLLLRAIEGLPNKEVSLVLDLDPKTVSKRYTRALLRLQQALSRDTLEPDA